MSLISIQAVVVALALRPDVAAGLLEFCIRVGISEPVRILVRAACSVLGICPKRAPKARAITQGMIPPFRSSGELPSPSSLPSGSPMPSDLASVDAVLLWWALREDVPVPLSVFRKSISRTRAFAARRRGELVLVTISSGAAIRPSELARYLRGERRNGAGQVAA